MGKIGVLELVNQNKPRAGSFRRQEIIVLAQKIIGTRDHVTKGSQIFLLEHVLDDCKDSGDLPATLDNLFAS